MKVSSQGNNLKVCKLLPPERGTSYRGWLEDQHLSNKPFSTMTS